MLGSSKWPGKYQVHENAFKTRVFLILSVPFLVNFWTIAWGNQTVIDP